MPFEFIKQEQICKGWSQDKKYCATAADGRKYLLRITSENKSDSREELFHIQRQLVALGVPMSRPIEFGKCDQGVYTVETWVEGQDAEEVIPSLSHREQYDYGVEAGRILKAIHGFPAPEQQPVWDARFHAKMIEKIKTYRECPIQFDGAEHIITYLKANCHLLKNRPQTFQHGDYHIGNMMMEHGKIIIIDFDRYDFGDPWEEFNRIVWCAQASPSFASGIVNGYFDGDVPLIFWKLLALYIGSNTLASISWAIPFGEKEVCTMLNQAKDVLSWYDNMQNPIPAWYKHCRP